MTSENLSSFEHTIEIEEDSAFGSVPTTGEVVRRYTFVRVAVPSPTTATDGAKQPSPPSSSSPSAASNEKPFASSSPSPSSPTEDGRFPIASFISYGASLLNFYCPSPNNNNGSASQSSPSSPSMGPDGLPLLPLSSDVIVGYDTVEAFAAQPAGPYFGVTVGRYCNRIAKGTFSLDQPKESSAGADDGSGHQQQKRQQTLESVQYALALNNGPNHLHGGPNGYHHRNWRSEVITSAAALSEHMDRYRYFAPSASEQGPASTSGSSSSLSPPPVAYPCLVFFLSSGDGDEGYPGELSVGVIYSVGTATTTTASTVCARGDASVVHRIRIDHLARLVTPHHATAITSPPPLSTVVNLTNHAYFNLSAVDAAAGDAQRAAEELARLREAEVEAALAWERRHGRAAGGGGVCGGQQSERYRAYLGNALAAAGHQSTIAALAGRQQQSQSTGDAYGGGSAQHSRRSSRRPSATPFTAPTQPADAGDAQGEQQLQRKGSFVDGKTETGGLSVAAEVVVADYPITDHHLAINAAYFTPTDSTAIPTGAVQSVAEVPAMNFYHCDVAAAAISGEGGNAKQLSFFDAPSASSGSGIIIGRRIGEAIDDTATEQIAFGHGYDHNWCLAATASHNSPSYRLAAVLTDPTLSRRFLRVFTTQPGVQVYAGNFLDGSIVGKGGKRIPRRGGLCLETQHYPDSPNHPHFPSTRLDPHQNFHQTTVFELGNM